ncbi:tetratricopeptide repeat-containing protein [Candidatus Gracilibacteria bacterium]|nr:tetratricopeptide repeat-containing protein [Candidatus Gracilibacteria bacterium]
MGTDTQRRLCGSATTRGALPPDRRAARRPTPAAARLRYMWHRRRPPKPARAGCRAPGALHRAESAARITAQREHSDRQCRQRCLATVALRASAGYFRQSLALAREIGDQRGEGWALGALGQVCINLGDLTQAEQLLRQSLALARATGDRRYEGMMLIQLVRVVLYEVSGGSSQEQVQQSGFRIQDSEGRAALQVADRRLQIGADMAIAQAAAHQKRHQLLKVALEQCEVALATLREVNARDKVALALLVKGWLCLELGDPAAAETCFLAAYTSWQQLDHRLRCAEALSGLAAVALTSGDLATASGFVDDVLRVIHTTRLNAECEIVTLYLTCHRVLCAAADGRAEVVLAAGRALLQDQAAQLSTAEARQRFLYGIAAHRTLLA